MARTFAINSELPSRTFTVTQDGECRTFNAYTGVANVTTANVRAAGALMDDEVTNLAAVKSFDPDDYAAASHTHVSADITDATDSASVGKIVKFGSQGQVIFACTSATAVTGTAATSGSGGFFSSNTGTGLFTLSTSGNHFNAGSGAFIVANNGNVTGTGTFTASNLSGTNTGDQTSIVGITGSTAQFNTALNDGDFATLAGSEVLTNKTLTNPTVNNYTEGVVAIGNSGTSQTLALTSGTFQTCTLTGNCTFTMPTATAGKSFILKLLTGAGSYTATFTSVKWPGGTAPTITATASKFDLVSFVADGSAWSGSIIQNYTA